MYVVVNHKINNAAAFWATAQSATAALPPGLKIIHTIPSIDGTKAVCLWEAGSVDAVRTFLDPATVGMAQNEYFESLNKEGIALPTLSRNAGA
jgi:hypothetical protein